MVRYHVTVLSNFARAYDRYALCYDKAQLPASSFPDRFFPGVLAALCEKAGLCVRECFGDYDRTAFGSGSPQQILLVEAGR